jgi:hypothetical protein
MIYSGDDFYDDDVTSGLARAYERGERIDPREDIVCHRAGHVDGCSGAAGGEHELRPGWIAYEDDGLLVEVEVAP